MLVRRMHLDAATDSLPRIVARGAYDAAAILHAAAIVRAKPSPAMWPPEPLEAIQPRFQ